MRSAKVAGLIFTNVHDELMEQLTDLRSMASVPFGARYRLIDFPLSNLVNAGVTNIGLIIKEKYRSLLDHVGSGIAWDLDRKKSGLHLMPPYNTQGAKRYNSHIEALYGSMDFVKRCNADYIITYNADIVANVDINAVVKSHIDRKADITVVYTNGVRPHTHKDAVSLSFDKDERLIGYTSPSADEGAVDYSMNIMVYSKNVLEEYVEQAYRDNKVYIDDTIKNYKVCGYRHNGFCALMDGETDYYNANMKLLDPEIRKDLFCKERPILTKTRDDMPTRYGVHSKVNNCFIADGCVIEGTVKNSILFRGVKVKKGATVENCIIMQGGEIGENADIKNVITDKNAIINDGVVANGTEKNVLFIRKNQVL